MQNAHRVNTAYYDRNAAAWAAAKTNSFLHEDQFRRFTRLLRAGSRVIDIGCAHGRHVPLFLGIGQRLRYEGLDLSRGLLAIARRRYPQLPFYRANIADRRSLLKKRFDGFWASAVLMHVPLPEWPKMLENIERLVKPGGAGYVFLPNARPGRSSKTDRRHFTYWTPKRFRSVVTPRGWSILESGRMLMADDTWYWFIVRLPR